MGRPLGILAIIDKVESFIGKMRDGLLNGEVLDTLEEAKGLVEARRKAYNRIRSHSPL